MYLMERDNTERLTKHNDEVFFETMIIYSVYMQNVDLRYSSITSLVKEITNIWTGIDIRCIPVCTTKITSKMKIFLISFDRLRIS